MTEQTQTTAERIRNLIFDAIQDSPYGDESIVAAPLGVTIAAEIDRLTAERDEALTRRERLLSYLAWLIGGWNATPGTHSGRLSTETGYGDDETVARRLVSEMKNDRSTELSRLTAQLAEARAEVERLRVPALALELLKGEGWTVADYVAKAEEAARARAAKESP